MAGSESRFPSPKFNFKRSKTGISNQNVSKVELNLLKAVLGSELHKIWRNFFTAQRTFRIATRITLHL